MVAGTLVDDDPETALAHARAARDRASRVAVVREAVGVAAYHAGDFAEAAREIRAYRRMSGDVGYRAVLADCERALGRPEVALRLVAEALTDSPDAEEAIELRLVEAGARRDLGEQAAARLVLEAELGGRPTPGSLDASDPHRLRVAAAYADLLQELGEEQLAEEWHSAVAAAEPDDMDIEFTELEFEFTELEFEDDDTDVADVDTDVAVSRDPSDTDGADGDADRSELEESLAGEPGNSGAGFDAEVEAEVAELLGEIDVPADGTGASGDDPASS